MISGTAARTQLIPTNRAEIRPSGRPGQVSRSGTHAWVLGLPCFRPRVDLRAPPTSRWGRASVAASDRSQTWQATPPPHTTTCQAPGFVEGVSSGCGGCLLGGVGSGLFRRGWGVSVLVFFWGVHVDRGMRADGVVPVDPLGRRDLQVVDGVPGALVSDQFGFIQRVECLGERVVVGVALGADRGDGVAVGKGRARNRSRCTGRPDPNGE